MSKKIIFLILAIIVIIPSLVYPASVTRTTAEQVAMNWYSERNEKASNDFRIVESFIEKENTENIYFIFNFDKTGFVMVSADDAAIPILGYVFEHNYTLENHPPQFDAMLASFKEQIVYAKKNNLSASKEAQDEWERLNVITENFEKNRDFSRLGPLLSSLWNQNYSWNTYCPPDAGGPGGYVYAGCVAVAMAQVMNYWGHPTTGTGSHGYTHPTYGYLSADFGATTYNFPMNNTTPDNDIRELLYHCGVSIDMQYGPTGSGAYTSDVVYALETYFDYDTSAYYDQKVYYSNTVWENMIRDNLDDGRPLQYRGYGTGGHSFNLDGYEDSVPSHFHFNWGWSGSYNGYYYLNDLTPGSYNFTSDQAAIFDIFPVTGVFDPPTNLTANVVNGNDVDLSWTAPGGGGVIVELMNDNGSAAGYHGSLDIGDMAAANLDSGVGTYPVTFQSLKVLLYDFGGVGSADINLHIFETTARGAPGALIHSTGSFTNSTFYPTWLEVDISAAGITAADAFFVAVELTSGTSGSIPSYLMDNQTSIDAEKNYYYNGVTWVEHYSFWGTPGSVGYNMIRAVVETSGSREITLGNSMQSKKDFAHLKSTSGFAEITLLPENLINNNPMNFNRDRATLSGYIVYRDSSPIHTITDPGITTYTDYGLANGDYSYYVTATYTSPVGESVASNSAYVTVGPELTVDPSSWNYGEIAVGGTSLYTVFELSNTGSETITISSVTLADRDVENFNLDDPNTYPVNLDYSESINIYVAFAPVSVGEKTINLQINDDRAITNVPLTGTGWLFANDWCPTENTLFGQSPYDGTGSWQAATSDLAPGYLRAEDFWSIGEPICGINFWGINAYYDNGWYVCENEDPMTFDIIFYEDNSGLPGTEVCSYNLILDREDTGFDYGSYNLYHYSADLDPCCTINEGWVSIQGVSVDDPDCWFLWATSPLYNTYSLMYDGATWSYDEYDLSLCLTGQDVPPEPPVVTIVIINNGDNVELTWDTVPGANSYNVYSSSDPYGTFTIEPTGTAIPGTSWSESTSEKKFYHVTASTDYPPSRANYHLPGKSAIRKAVPIRKEVDKENESTMKLSSIEVREIR